MTQTPRTLLVFCFSLTHLTATACTAPQDTRGMSTDAIQDGSQDDADPAVGIVLLADNSFCSGTLIAPTVVLTAAHCWQANVIAFYTGRSTAIQGVDLAPSLANMVKHDVAETRPYTGFTSFVSCPNAISDVALVHLKAPIGDITPVAYAHDAPASAATFSAVGFGAHDENGSTFFAGKRSASEDLTGTGDSWILVKENSGIADHGDSGGPIVLNGRIAGVTSCHVDGYGKGHTQEYYARIDRAATWIDGMVATWSGAPGAVSAP
jgi:secreted trypsin-like serine protease